MTKPVIGTRTSARVWVPALPRAIVISTVVLVAAAAGCVVPLP